jgi:hypothetical protein
MFENFLRCTANPTCEVVQSDGEGGGVEKNYLCNVNFVIFRYISLNYDL